MFAIPPLLLQVQFTLISPLPHPQLFLPFSMINPTSHSNSRLCKTSDKFSILPKIQVGQLVACLLLRGVNSLLHSLLFSKLLWHFADSLEEGSLQGLLQKLLWAFGNDNDGGVEEVRSAKETARWCVMLCQGKLCHFLASMKSILPPLQHKALCQDP